MSLFNMCAKCPCDSDPAICGSFFQVFIARIVIVVVSAGLYITSAILVFDLL